mmetsp:Transcript_6838/g.9755  ORF Transcript_6838/g.9755 Transcript_6838/m.9755 type:complete len:210 (-) Transcript_6838:671-1300(-)
MTLIDAFLQGFDVGREAGYLSLQVRLEVGSLGRFEFVCLELGLAPVGLLNLLGLLFFEHGDHVVDGLDDLRKGVQFDSGGENGELRVLRLPGNFSKGFCGFGPLLVDRGASRLQEAAVGGRHGVPRLVALQNFDRLRDGRHLVLPRSLSLLVVFVCIGTSGLQVCQELLVLSQGGLFLCVILLGLRESVDGVCQLILFLLGHLLAVVDL